MQVRRFHLVPAVAITAVLVLAVTLLLVRGLFDALLMIAAVAVLAGMYMLRRYARAQVIYRRADDATYPRGTTGRAAPPRSPHDHRRPGRNGMTTWRVQDVMTTEVITAAHDATVAEIVALLTERQITAVPIVDRFDVVLGVVSWTDLREKIDVAAPEGGSPVGWWRRRVPPLVEWPQGTAVGVMSGPALTIGADASLPAAARVMYRRGVGRLLVVDGG